MTPVDLVEDCRILSLPKFPLPLLFENKQILRSQNVEMMLKTTIGNYYIILFCKLPDLRCNHYINLTSIIPALQETKVVLYCQLFNLVDSEYTSTVLTIKLFKLKL